MNIFMAQNAYDLDLKRFTISLLCRGVGNHVAITNTGYQQDVIIVTNHDCQAYIAYNDGKPTSFVIL